MNHFLDGINTSNLTLAGAVASGLYPGLTMASGWVDGTNGINLHKGPNGATFWTPYNVQGSYAVNDAGQVLGYDPSRTPWQLGPIPAWLAAMYPFNGVTVQGLPGTSGTAPTVADIGATSAVQVEDAASPYFGQSWTDVATKTEYRFDPVAAVSVQWWMEQGLAQNDAQAKASAAASKLGRTVIQPPPATVSQPVSTAPAGGSTTSPALNIDRPSTTAQPPVTPTLPVTPAPAEQVVAAAPSPSVTPAAAASSAGAGSPATPNFAVFGGVAAVLLTLWWAFGGHRRNKDGG